MKEYLSNCCVKNKNEETGVEEQYKFYDGAKAMMTTGPLNIILPCTIIAFISDGMGWNAGITFAFALVAIAPFAERLGFVTEQLALHTNETIGGLLNATFGNATELIVAIAALSVGKYRLVQLSLLGSILSNVLLVLGTAFWLGGYYHKTLTFGKSTAQINCVLLMLGVMGILFPTVLTWTNAETPNNEAGFSRATAILNFFGYILFLYFQIVTHPDAYDENVDAENIKEEVKPDEEEQLLDNNIKQKSSPRLQQPTNDIAITTSPGVKADGKKSENDVEQGGISSHLGVVSAANDLPVTNKQETANTDGLLSPIGSFKIEGEAHEGAVNHEDEEEEEDILGFWYAIVWLAIITVFISFLSDALVLSIDIASVDWHVSGVFLSTIVIPIIGEDIRH